METPRERYAHAVTMMARFISEGDDAQRDHWSAKANAASADWAAERPARIPHLQPITTPVRMPEPAIWGNI